MHVSSNQTSLFTFYSTMMRASIAKNLALMINAARESPHPSGPKAQVVDHLFNPWNGLDHAQDGIGQFGSAYIPLNGDPPLAGLDLHPG